LEGKPRKEALEGGGPIGAPARTHGQGSKFRGGQPATNKTRGNLRSRAKAGSGREKKIGGKKTGGAGGPRARPPPRRRPIRRGRNFHKRGQLGPFVTPASGRRAKPGGDGEKKKKNPPTGLPGLQKTSGFFRGWQPGARPPPGGDVRGGGPPKLEPGGGVGRDRGKNLDGIRHPKKKAAWVLYIKKGAAGAWIFETEGKGEEGGEPPPPCEKVSGKVVRPGGGGNNNSPNFFFLLFLGFFAPPAD